MFRFAHPEYLYALYALPLFFLLFWFISRNRKKLLEKFADKKLHTILLPSFSRNKFWLRSIIVLFALLFLIIAASNPQIGTKVENVKQSGIDVYILLDVSLSMQAQDIQPSRLEKAKFEISNLIQKLRGDRIGLIVFAGEAFVQFPLTTDYSAASLFLSAVDVNSIPEQGTAIASAIKLATKSFDYSSKTEKVMVLITDGEDHEGDVMQAAKAASDKGIMIYSIGMGSTDGVPIPVYNNQGQQIGYKKDKSGSTVLTKLDPTILKEIADATGGKYYQGSNYQDELDLIYKNLSSLRKTEFGTKKVTDYADRFYYFLIPGIILLLLEFFITERKSPLFSKMFKRIGLE